MQKTWQASLKIWGDLRSSVASSKHTTLAVGGKARWYFKAKDKEALQQVLSIIPLNIHVLPLGRGSNLLVSDAGFDGVVLDLGCLQTIAWKNGRLLAEAGCRMSKLAQNAASHGRTGLEFMATVPGDLGGGVAMNAGAFGQQVSDALYAIEILHRDGKNETLTREQLSMQYRYTDLPKDCVVVSACFDLSEKDVESVRMRMRDMRHQRSQTQPLAWPNCGSVFKNPDGDYAARLIEAAGLKGEQIGDAQISEVHANFIVNHGSAKAQDVFALMTLAQQAVKQKFRVDLKPEVRILGELNGD